MGKTWDGQVPPTEIWRECLRVLKPGAFAFVMCIPRSDCLSRMIVNLEDAGFDISFSPIYHAFASGFPKAQNIGKAVDKRLGAEREVIGENPNDRTRRENPLADYGLQGGVGRGEITAPASSQAKALDGSYGGFQPKPGVEVIIVAMKPLSEKTFVDQALKNGKGITWLDDGRIPYESERDKEGARFGTQMDIRGNNLKSPIGVKGKDVLSSQLGRFPANLLCSDDVLNDGRELSTPQYKSEGNPAVNNWTQNDRSSPRSNQVADSGSFSRYFDLDKWAEKTFPFLIVPKAGKSEKNAGLDGKGHQHNTGSRTYDDVCANCGKKLVGDLPYRCTCEEKVTQKRQTKGNFHPTVKPLKLMLYLITLGSREGDTVIDPFGGSGTTALASKMLNRKCIISETVEKYCEISVARCSQTVMDLSVMKKEEADPESLPPAPQRLM